MPNAKPRRQAGIYVRISQDRTGNGTGVRRQEADCRAVAERLGWDVADLYRDNDRSAYKGTPRPAFSRLIDDLKRGSIDAVVAWHPDRLTRSPRELEDLVELIEATGAAVATVQAGEYDLSTATGRMSARVVGAVARHESEHKGERIRRQRDQAASEGRPNGGRRAFGYESDGMTLRDDEAAVVREAVDRVLAGESLTAIARDWNGRGVPAASGGQWRTTALRAVLAGPRVAGLRVHRGETVGPAAWPPIISIAEHERIRAVLGDPRRRRRGRPIVQLLTGMLNCGRCGARLRASRRQDGRRRYQCDRSPGHDGCGALAITAAPLEELVVEATIVRLDTPRLIRALRAKESDADGSAISELADAEARLTELAEMFGSGEISRGEWLSARSRLEARIEAARRKVRSTSETEALAPFTTEKGALRAAWPELSIDQKRAVLQAVMDRVVIAPAGALRQRFDPDRVSIEWRV